MISSKLDNFVELRESDHRYFDKKKVEYLPTTTFVGSFYEKFDANMVAIMVARSEGVSTQLVLDRWEKQTLEGDRRHKSLENYFKTTTISSENIDLKPMVLNIASQYSHYYRIINEQTVYDTDNLIAGKIDMLLFPTSHKNCPVDFCDFKNYNKGINQIEIDKNGKQRNKFMFGPLEHLMDSSYNRLCLQLSEYAFMFQKQTGRRIGKLFGHYIDPINPLINYQIPCAYLKYEIIEMLAWRKDNPIHLQENIPAEKPKTNLNQFNNWDL